MSAAVSARRRRPGPSEAASITVPSPFSGATSTAVMADRNPAMVHTAVDMALVLMADSRAASGFSAEARMAVPYLVRSKNSARAAVSAGTTMSTSSCSLRIRVPKSSQRPSKGVGKLATAVKLGSQKPARNTTCAAPIVATNRITLGALANRRTTVNSMSPPKAAPAARPAMSAIG